MALTARCAVCDHSCKIVQPSGPRYGARVAMWGEKPGRQEAAFGRVFVGDTGKEMDGLYLYLAGLNREDVYVSNTVKCQLGQNNNTPTPDQIDTCASFHMPSELERVNPDVLVLLGASACSLLQHATANGQPCQPVELDKDHGRPVIVDGKIATVRCERYFGDWEGVVWTFYHPASALHDTSSMTPLMDDFKTLGDWLKGKWTPPRTEFAPEYAELGSTGDFILATDGHNIRPGWGVGRTGIPWVPTDTENDGPLPWSLQFATSPANGYLIRASNHRLLRLYREYLFEAVEAGGGLLCHNSPHDLEVGAKLGVWEWGKWPRFRDTMQEAYHQGNLPQGLKALGWRLLGIRMQGWEDVVLPPSKKRAIRWLMDGLLLTQDTMQEQKIEQFTKPQGLCTCGLRVGINKDGTPAAHARRNGCEDGRIKTVLGLSVPYWVPSQAEKDLKRILSHSDSPTYDIWEKVEEARGGLSLDSTGIVRELGRIPIPSIANCESKIALDYAGQDACVAGIIGEVLAERAQRLVTPQLDGKRMVRGDWEIMQEDL